VRNAALLGAHSAGAELPVSARNNTYALVTYYARQPITVGRSRRDVGIGSGGCSGIGTSVR